MEALLLVLVALFLVAPLAAVIGLGVLWSRHRALARDVNAMREAIAALQSTMAARPATAEMRTEPAEPSAADAPVPPHEPAPAPVSPLAAPAASPPEPAEVPAAPETPSAPFTPAPASVPESAPAVARAGLEERLGARLPMWLGAIAMALAGIFLVHYSIQKDLITPTMRVALGLISGVAMLSGGEWLASRRVRVAESLSAAGIAVIFAALVAGVSLYHLIGLAIGFGLIALTTLAAIALSLRRGPIVALVGLAGGFVTPALLGSTDPQPAPLFAFFWLIQVALIAISRARPMWHLIGLAQLAGAAWIVVWLLDRNVATHTPVLGSFLLLSLVPLIGAARRAPAEREWPRFVVWTSALASAVLLGFVVPAGSYGTIEWAFLGMLALGVIALGALDPSYAALGWVTLGASLLTGAMWYWNGVADADLRRFVTTIAVMSALHAIAAYAAHWWRHARGAFAALSVVSAVAGFSITWSLVSARLPDAPWSACALGCGILYALAAWPRLARRDGTPDTERALAALLVGVTTFASMAVPLEFDRAWIGVAWALEALALAWLAGRIRVAALRWLSLILTAGVSVRLLFNPMIVDYPIGTHPWLSWLLYGYGVPALALAGASWLFARQEDEHASVATEAASFAIGAALLVLSIRHYFAPESLTAPLQEFLELGLYGPVLMLYGGLLATVARRRQRASLGVMGELAQACGALFTAGVPGFVLLPTWTDHHVGHTPVFNSLLVAFGAAAALALWGARRLRAREEPLARIGAIAYAVAGIWFVFLLVTMQIRHFFHGDLLRGGSVTSAELYGYSIAWVLLGTVLLVLGIANRSTVLRFASLAVMLAAVVKVFVFDFSELEGLYRVFSFFGLGVSLLLLAFLYQRFVFRREAA